MLHAFKGLFTSKKFLAAVAGVLVSIAARYGLNLSETEVAGILAIFISYILAQGQTDKGKGAAQVQAAAAAIIADQEGGPNVSSRN